MDSNMMFSIKALYIIAINQSPVYLARYLYRCKCDSP